MAWHRFVYCGTMCVLAMFILHSRKYFYLKARYEENQKYLNDYSRSTSVQRYLDQIYCDGCLLCVNGIMSAFSIHPPSKESDVISNNNAHNISMNSSDFLYNNIKLCPELPPGLGPITDSESKILITEFEAKYGELKFGGIFKPKNCIARHRVAVIIAYRGCKRYLAMFLFVLHQVLIKQQLDYQIFVVEQTNRTQLFNRGKLLNIGFKEAQTYRKSGWTCMIFHEANIMPTDSRNLYRCSWYPKQLATIVERTNRPPYVPKFGGALAMTPEQYSTVNGFSNNYWGNDGDFQDLYNRISVANYLVEGSIPILGKYKSLKKYAVAAHVKSEYMSTVSPLYLLDGLTTLTYTVNSFKLRRMYTHIKVNIDEANDTDYYNTFNNVYDKLLNLSFA